MVRKQIAILIPIMIVLNVIHVFLYIYVFPNLTPPGGEIAKLAYEGMTLGLYTLIGYLLNYLTMRGNQNTMRDTQNSASPVSHQANKSGNSIVQALILAIVLYSAFRIAEALVNIFITVFDDLRAEGEISGASKYGMNVIDKTLTGYLFFFFLLPLCFYMVSRVTRKLGRNPGYWFFLFVALIVVFSSILTNFQSLPEWSQAFVKAMGPIFGSEPSAIRSRDVFLFVAFQVIGASVFSALFALFMFVISGLRNWFALKLDRVGI